MPHERGTCVLHHGSHIGEVEVDQPRSRDQVAGALDALAQDVVGDLEGVDGGRAVEHLEQAIVGNHDDGVAGRPQLFDAAIGRGAAARTFEAEGRGDDPHGQRAELACDADDRAPRPCRYLHLLP